MDLFKSLMFSLLLVLTGCKDKYQEGYSEGYAAGYAQAHADAEASCGDKVEAAKQSCSYSSQSSGFSTVTEVCGGNGMDYNGKHYSPGKTGCVRITADGRVERY